MKDLQPPITRWDRAIMETYPYRFAPSWSDRGNWAKFDEMIEWSKQNFKRDEFTWKSMTFFFKRKDDLTLFMLRWG